MIGNGAEVPEDAWSHIAAVFREPIVSGTQIESIVDFYVNGSLIESTPGIVWTTSGEFGVKPPRGIAMGFHPFAEVGQNPFYDAMAFRGKVYEPVVTLGALSPSQFTVIPTPGSALMTVAGLSLLASRRRR